MRIATGGIITAVLREAMGKSFATVNCTATFNCTLAAVTWETEDGRVVTTGSKPSLTDDNKKLYCVQTWIAPDGSATGRVKSQVATMRVNNLPTLTVHEAASGSANVVTLDQKVLTTFASTATDARNTSMDISCTYPTETFGGTDADGEYEIKATNNCGTDAVPIMINTQLRHYEYYEAVRARFRTRYRGAEYDAEGHFGHIYAYRKEFALLSWWVDNDSTPQDVETNKDICATMAGAYSRDILVKIRLTSNGTELYVHCYDNTTMPKQQYVHSPSMQFRPGEDRDYGQFRTIIFEQETTQDFRLDYWTVFLLRE